MGTIVKDLGIATAYGYAKSKGYTGTEEEFAELMASYAEVAEEAKEYSETSEAYAKGTRDGSDVSSSDPAYHNNSKYFAEQAGGYADSAGTSASTATDKAGEASASAASASASATTATTKAGEATDAAASAASSASAAGTSEINAAASAGTASTAATNAANSATAAQTAQAAAETAQGKAEDAQEAAEETAESIAGIAGDKAPVITSTASGLIAIFNDGADGMPLKALTAGINYTQPGNGDPSPDNVRPIYGYTGMNVHRTSKNLLPSLASNYTGGGVTWTKNSDGTITMNGTASRNHAAQTQRVLLIAGVTYTLSGLPSGASESTYRMDFRTAGLTTLDSDYGTLFAYSSGLTFTATVTKYVEIGIRIAQNYVASNVIIKPQLEVGSIATEYEPYSDAVYTASWSDEAGTVYGGTFDVVNGVLTVDTVMLEYDGSEDEAWERKGTSSQNRYFEIAANGIISAAENGIAVCDRYVNTNIGTGTTNIGIGVVNNAIRLRYVLDSAQTVSDCKAFLASNNLHILCKPTTPVIYNIAPVDVMTALGFNAIYTDCNGDVTLEYCMDTNAYTKAQNERKADIISDGASGGIVTFADGADSLPIKEMTIGIGYVQHGIGDPSPTNVRPISGWTGAKVWRTGKNLINAAGINHSSGTKSNKVFLKAGTYYIYQFTDSPSYNTSYVYSLTGESGTWTNIPTVDDGYAVADRSSSSYNRLTNRFTLHQDCHFGISIGGNSAVASNPIDIMLTTDGTGYANVPPDASTLAWKDTMYEPYDGQEYAITFPSSAGTVYGGTLDIKSGVLRVTKACIASYAGETLPGAWVSDRDVYTQGGTPTTGAQVVYNLATPITYTLTPTDIHTLLGDNSIWADTGDVSVEYCADTKAYVDETFVKKTDYATDTTAGVVKADANNGIGIESQHKLYINYADSNLIKAGTGNYRPVSPPRQHESTFYGLAKAAGDTTQPASSNAVGTYTDAAKIAIQKMLGIYQAPWELIREDTFTNATEADHVITVDSNGQAFELTDIILMFETPKQETYSKKGLYGQVHFYINGISNAIQLEPGAWEQQANGAAHGVVFIGEQRDGMMFVQSTTNITTSNSYNVRYRYMGFGSDDALRNSGLFPVSLVNGDAYFNEINIKAVTGTGHYILYGKRKWQ